MTTDELLSAEERAELLRCARRTLEVFLETHSLLALDKVEPGLLRPGGAFVTLHRGRELRGCIGTFEARDPIVETVQRMAISAATGDPRFPRVQPDELDALHIEISVLSPLRQAAPEEVEVGTHGVYITRGPQRGVLLPQVASENNWDRETFLDHTCLKAGLPVGAWREPGTVIEVFTAQVFGEPPRS